MTRSRPRKEAFEMGRGEIKNKFFKKYTFISYQYKILSKLKKIEFRGYFTHGLVLQRKIKSWSRNNHSSHKWRHMQVDLFTQMRRW